MEVKDVARAAAGAVAMCGDGKTGFFILLRWLIEFFLPPISLVFFL
jgi:hypothetical protein